MGRRSRRRMVALAGPVVLASLLAVGLAAGAQQPSSRSRARTDAAKQLAELVLPSGAMKVGSDPSKGGVLKPWPAGATNPRYVVDDYGYWRVPGSPADVASSIQAHTPAGARGSFGGTPTSGVYGFGWPFRYSSEVVLRALYVQVAPASGGGSAVRADGVAVWVPPHPGWDQVPAAARIMTVVQRVNGKRSGPFTFRNRREVQRVTRLIDRAAVVPPEVFHCPRETGAGFKLIFQAQRPGPILARAHRSGAGCASIVLSVNGRSGPPLVGVYQLDRILNRLISAKQKR